VKRNRITKGAVSLVLFAFTVGVGLAASGAAWAKARKAEAVDPTSVTACGTLGANNTIYLVTTNLVQTGSGNCIVVTGNYDTLDLQGNDITGPGGSSTGAGILFKGYQDVFEGSNGTVSGFAEGVLDQGGFTAGDGINVDSNQVGLEVASGGVGTTQIWTNFSADDNTDQGVYLKTCNNACTISDFDASGNGADGVLVTGSGGPRISVFTAASNGGDGVHVGCVSGCGTNSQVKVGDAPLGVNTADAITLNNGDGIFLDVSEAVAKDQVYFILSKGNGVSSGVDMHDATSACGSNHWVHNVFGTADAGGVPNPACIPNF
jgi:hypothetical protein